MLTTIEKVMFLQNVEVFGEVSTEHLAYLAAIAEEVSVVSGTTIYREQDASDAMYLVVDGRVRLHREGMEVAVAGPKEALGVWALFDDEPRVVTALAIEDTRLLRIDKEDFIDLLSDHVEIIRGVLMTLVKRLRGLAGRVGVEQTARSAT
ncbi:MAG: cyclic nucleotide-binding domain-containing protein [Candidatus Latescibacteria bacterium]|nr:cyclic nucleotide-binding domain-containing protein [Candidatus Latescibacterota bacterium]